MRTIKPVACYVDAQHASAISGDVHDFVIHGRSKERSDAAQTPGAAPQPKGSMPGLRSVATVLDSAPLHLSARPRHGSSGLRDAAARLLAPPVDDEVIGRRPTVAGETPT
ncbi:hypothetical protein MesoLj113a_09730 [Mesorhizobium sp. 113-1-2]|nr:hypothetical protein MesoLj113a_09730 [Mesorhizobium sp. 113-1-2]